MSQITCCWLCN